MAEHKPIDTRYFFIIVDAKNPAFRAGLDIYLGTSIGLSQ